MPFVSYTQLLRHNLSCEAALAAGGPAVARVCVADADLPQFFTVFGSLCKFAREALLAATDAVRKSVIVMPRLLPQHLLQADLNSRYVCRCVPRTLFASASPTLALCARWPRRSRHMLRTMRTRTHTHSAVGVADRMRQLSAAPYKFVTAYALTHNPQLLFTRARDNPNGDFVEFETASDDFVVYVL